jgi:hypothetical protein
MQTYFIATPTDLSDEIVFFDVENNQIIDVIADTFEITLVRSGNSHSGHGHDYGSGASSISACPSPSATATVTPSVTGAKFVFAFSTIQSLQRGSYNLVVKILRQGETTTFVAGRVEIQCSSSDRT